MDNVAMENLSSGWVKNNIEIIVGLRDRKAEALYNELCNAMPWH